MALNRTTNKYNQLIWHLELILTYNSYTMCSGQFISNYEPTEFSYNNRNIPYISEGVLNGPTPVEKQRPAESFKNIPWYIEISFLQLWNTPFIQNIQRIAQAYNTVKLQRTNPIFTKTTIKNLRKSEAVSSEADGHDGQLHEDVFGK